MNVLLAYVRAPLLCAGVLLLLSSLASPTSAQVSTAAPTFTNQAISHPEGTVPPAYIASFDALFLPDSNYNTSSGTPEPISCNTFYCWTVSGSSHYRTGFSDYNGSTPYDMGKGAFDFHSDLGSGSVAMTPTNCTAGVYGVGSSNGTGQMASLSNPPPYVLGVTLIKVVTSDGKPLPAGAVLTMQNHYGSSFGVSTYNLPAGATSCTMGQGQYVAANAPYAFGLKQDTYDIWVTVPGYAAAEVDQTPGSGFAGNTITCTVAASGYSPTPTIGPTATGDNPDQPPAAGGTGSSTSAIDFSSLFTTQPADLTALQGALAKFMTYGPFGAIGSLFSAYTNAFSSTNTSLYADGSDPNYWTIYLNGSELENDTASMTAAPAGYNPYSAYQPAAPPTTIYNSFWPTQLSMLPYASFILDGRRIALVALWVFVLFNLVRRFTPELRI